MATDYGQNKCGYDDLPLEAYLPYALREACTTEDEIHDAVSIDWSGCFRGRGMRLSDSDVLKLTHQTNKGAVAILGLLPTATKLEKLNLSNNMLGAFGPQDVDALIAGIVHLPSLRELNIAYNQLTDFGKEEQTALKLWAALPSTSITDLNVSNNNLSHFGNNFRPLVELLKTLPSTNITKLNLSANHLTNNSQDAEAVDALVAALPSTKLRHLDLGANRIAVSTALTLAAACAQTPSLQELHLGGNHSSLNDQDNQAAVAEMMPNACVVYESRVSCGPAPIGRPAPPLEDHEIAAAKHH